MTAKREEWRRWYKTARWQRLRAAQLQREPLCRTSGPFQSTCVTCHNSAKQMLETSGRVKGCDENGVPFEAGGGVKAILTDARQTGPDPLISQMPAFFTNGD